MSAYRPWTDAKDPTYAEALALARTDDELRHWFEAHCAAQEAIRARFRAIAVPEGLKEQIISERTVWTRFPHLSSPRTLAAVAALVICGSLFSIWLMLRPSALPSEQINLAGFRGRMVSSVLRMYNMDLETNDAQQIRSFLARNNAVADYELTPKLAGATQTGCGVLTWQGARVSMVCFRSGDSLPAGAKGDVFLFVVDRTVVPDAPKSTQPLLAKVNQLVTASWTAGDKVYVLAAAGDEEFLRKFL